MAIKVNTFILTVNDDDNKRVLARSSKTRSLWLIHIIIVIWLTMLIKHFYFQMQVKSSNWLYNNDLSAQNNVMNDDMLIFR